MTYLDLVNNILIRLRERQVSSVSENGYSRLIGQLVNDAKHVVEDSWEWSKLRTVIPVTTANGTENYTITGSDEEFVVHQVLDATNNSTLKYVDSTWIARNQNTSGSPVTGKPMYYSFNELDSNGNVTVDFYPIPNGAFTINFDCTLRSSSLVNDSDVLDLYSHPIEMLTWAKAIEERGEDGGMSASSAYATAQQALADAIAFDAARHPEETIWKVQ